MENKVKIEQTLRTNGISKSVEVEEVENGFVITIRKWGREEGSDEYCDECKKYISKTNPLEKKPEISEAKVKKSITEAMNEINPSYL